MDTDFYAMRIAVIDEAAQRSRWVMIVSSIAAIAIIGSSWNAFPLGLYEFGSSLWEAGKFAPDAPTEELQKALLKAWVEGMFVNASVFGIRFSITDAWLLGSGTLLVLAIWQFYALRRENHLIGSLLRDCSGEPMRLRAHVFHGIAGTQVFATVTDDDNPVTTIESSKGSSVATVRFAARMLLYLPVAAIIFIIITDVASIAWFDAIFRTVHQPLLTIVKQQTATSGNSSQLISFLVSNGVQEVAALALGFFTWFLLWRSGRYQQGTVKLLQEARNKGWDAIQHEQA